MTILRRLSRLVPVAAALTLAGCNDRELPSAPLQSMPSPPSFSVSGASATPGALLSWGFDLFGQVANTPAGTDFVAISAGNGHTVALRGDGSLVSWGDNQNGQVSATPTGTGFVAVDAGMWHSVALRADGSLVSWGANGSAEVSATPTGTGFIAVSAGQSHSVALRADGSLVSWGMNGSGIPQGTGFVAVAAGFAHDVALRSDGSLVSWGSDQYGQVSNTPTGTGFVAVDAGGYHSVALRADGSLVAWGNDGEHEVSGTPTGTGFVAIAAGGFHTVARRADGSLVAWGNDQAGEVSGTPAGPGFRAVAAGTYHTVAIQAPTGTADNTPPVIVPTVSGTQGSNGWYTSDVTVSWSVSDAESFVTTQTGCGGTSTFTTDATTRTVTCSAISSGGTSTISVTIKRDATAPVVSVIGVTAGATYTLGSVPEAGCSTTDPTSGIATDATFGATGGPLGSVTATCGGAVDLAGNVAAPASVTYTVTPPLDVTPPVVTPTITGTLGTGGWYTSDVTVTWTVADGESAVSSQTGCGPTTIGTDTNGQTVTCTATSAGGTASPSVTIKRDATAPAVSMLAVQDGVAYPVSSVPVASCATVDLTSGVATNASVSLTGTGYVTATCSGAVDKAGNAAIPTSATYAVTATLNVGTAGNGTGTVYVSPQQPAYVLGTSVTLSAVASGNASFGGWSGGVTGTTNPVTLTMNADKSVTATFNKGGGSTMQTLSVTVVGAGSVSSSPAGINCTEATSPCVATFARNATVTLTAAATTGNALGGWSGAVTGTQSSVSLTLNGDKSVTATFAPIPALVLTVDANGSVNKTTGAATITGTATCTSAQTVSINVDVTQQQTKGRTTTIVTSAGNTAFQCTGGSRTWTLTFTPSGSDKFAAGALNVTARALGAATVGRSVTLK